MADPCNDDCNTQSAAPVKKRSLFSKSLLSKASQPIEAVEFFSRSKEVFAQQLAEDERKRQKKLEKLERKRSSTKSESRELPTPEEKRRRVSSQREDTRSDHEYSPDGENYKEPLWAAGESTHPASESGNSRPNSSTKETRASPTTLSERYTKNLKSFKSETSTKAEASKTYISLSDSDSNDGIGAKSATKAASRPIILDDDDDDDNGFVASGQKQPAAIESELEMSEDEEFPELVRQARERARLKAQQQVTKTKSSRDQNRTSAGVEFGASGDASDDIFEMGAISAPDVDPTIQILITSKLEGSNPLVVRRKYSQNLKEVRWAWCDRQKFEDMDDLKDVAFLTYKGIKVFDSTPCRVLVQRDGSQGKLSLNNDGSDAEERVHLEAWTRAAWEFYQRRIAAKENKQLEESDDEEDEAQEEPVSRIKLIMRARDMEDFKLQVKPTTTIEKMVDAFRQKRNIPEEKTVALYFDGDKLDESSKIEDTELEDLEIIEVHIR